MEALIYIYKNVKFLVESNVFIYWGGNEGFYVLFEYVKGKGVVNGRLFIMFELVIFIWSVEVVVKYEGGFINF